MESASIFIRFISEENCAVNIAVIIDDPGPMVELERDRLECDLQIYIFQYNPPSRTATIFVLISFLFHANVVRPNVKFYRGIIFVYRFQFEKQLGTTAVSRTI